MPTAFSNDSSKRENPSGCQVPVPIFAFEGTFIRGFSQATQIKYDNLTGTSLDLFQACSKIFFCG